MLAEQTGREGPTGRAGQARWQLTWIFGRTYDIAISLAWLPVFLLAHVLVHLRGSEGDSLLRGGIVLALLVSFCHQPLTFGLVYGDATQYRLHKRLFAAAPVVAITLAAIAAYANLAIVIPIAALWNLQHTLQQRYGIQRIYAGRSKYGSARLDRALAYVPMIAVLGAVAAMPSTAALISRSGLDPTNAGAIRLLVSLRPIALGLCIAAMVATAVVIAAVLRQELAAGEAANPAKWLYQICSLGLLSSIVVDPAAGFIAYVSLHAIEYAVVVDRTAKRRYAVPPPDPSGRSLIGWFSKRAPGRLIFLGLIVASALAVHQLVHGALLDTVVYSIGALHFTYDAVIWKLRKPAVSKDFLIQPRLASG